MHYVLCVSLTTNCSILPYSLLNPYLINLQRLFEIDPLLPRLIVNKANVDNLTLLVGRVPVSVIIMRLIEECALSIKVSSSYMLEFCKRALNKETLLVFMYVCTVYHQNYIISMQGMMNTCVIA